jgi:hypothetical protein
MNVKILVPEKAAAVRRETEVAAAAAEEKQRGAEFLKARRLALGGSETDRRSAAEIASWLSNRVGDLVRASRVDLARTGRLAISAAYLVDRGRLGAYRDRLAEVSNERRDLCFLTSGAWPPYSFCDLWVDPTDSSGSVFPT